MRWRRAWWVAGLVLAVATASWAYGPSIHMGEADRFITFCEQHPQAGPQYDPDLLRRDRRFLLLGAMWPDLARAIVGAAAGKVDETSVDPHNRHFVTWMLEDALATYPADEWKVAFAVGNLDHCSGDAVSQGMLTQRLSVWARLGEMDVVTGVMDDHPGGENEAFIEGGLEFMQPHFDYYLDAVDDFLLAADGRAELLAALTTYLDWYAEYFGIEIDVPAAEAMAIVETAFVDFPRSFPPCAPGASPAMLRFARAGFDAAALPEIAVDWDELARVIGNGVLSDAFWDVYYDEGFYDYAATMLLTFRDGQPFYENFPNWSASMMKAGVIQSLAEYADLSEEGGRFVMDLAWYENDATVPVTSIDAASPPATVTLYVVVYNVPGSTWAGDEVQLRVREDAAGGALTAADTFAAGIDPWSYNEVGPSAFQVTFDPSEGIARGATGFFAELAPGADPQTPPSFTTDWAPYAAIDEIDTSKPCYTMLYSTYDRWPPSLRIDYPGGEVGP